MTKNKKRQINIEVLRIIAMLLVLVGHFNIACNGDVTYELVHTNLLKAIGIAEVKSWTFVCVPCFIVISGYFCFIGVRWFVDAFMERCDYVWYRQYLDLCQLTCAICIFYTLYLSFLRRCLLFG